MYKIATLNKISPVGLSRLTDGYTVIDNTDEANGILVRSQAMHDMEFSSDLLAIGRAGAGVNNIPLDRCAQEGIVVFNTPGANANAVKELVLAGMLLAARNIPEGLAWAKTLAGTEGVGKAVEKGKGQFAGTELKGKTLGVIGLGAIGAMVANAALATGPSYWPATMQSTIVYIFEISAPPKVAARYFINIFFILSLPRSIQTSVN